MKKVLQLLYLCAHDSHSSRVRVKIDAPRESIVFNCIEPNLDARRELLMVNVEHPVSKDPTVSDQLICHYCSNKTAWCANAS